MLTERIADHAAAYGIAGETVDGNDVEAVFAAASRAAATVRTSRKPFLLETQTYRLRGHYEPDDQAYVDAAELARWRARDPIALAAARLAGTGSLTDAGLRAMERDSRGRIEQAVAFAVASPYPALAELTTHVYA
jgi:pyruvate dehydrogenase E1 component alpha subunit